jgi:hypothetical protein
MAEHTRGPWTTEEARNVIFIVGPESSGPLRIAATPDRVVFEPLEEDRANARLIAAAPDLLAACKAMAEALDRHSEDCDFGEADERAFAAGHAAITKAESVTPPWT